jgi:hypothetical protein
MERKEYKEILLEEPVEALSLLGDIAPKEVGEPQVHDHVVLDICGGTTKAATSSRLVCDAGGDPHGVAGAPLRRRTDEETGFPLIEL